jgi:uncharacterized protein YkwD
MASGTGRTGRGTRRRRSRREARLVALGAAPAREYELEAREVSVGSAADNRIVVAEHTVSRHHARLVRKLATYQLVDLDSTNGTFVNGRRVRGVVTLKRGDEVRFGAARFAFLTGRKVIASPAPWGIRIGFATVAGMLVLLFLVAFVATRHYLDSPGTGAPRAPAASATAAAAKSASVLPETSSAAKLKAPADASAARVAPPPPPPGPEYDWLRRLNDFRALAKLPPVEYDAGLSSADARHVNYLIKNYAESIKAGALAGAQMHAETPGNPWYSPEGAAAGQHSDVDFMWISRGTLHESYTWALTDWMSGAFHRLPLLSPRLRRAGYAQICDGGLCVAALDAQSALDGAGAMLYREPIAFPPDGATVSLRTFNREWPDPLSSCPGYARPSGLPITLSLGAFQQVKLDKFSVKRADGDVVEACGFDSTSYVNPDPFTQQAARNVLRGHGAVVIVPRAPLAKGATYELSLTANGKPYQWKFSISP